MASRRSKSPRTKAGAADGGGHSRRQSGGNRPRVLRWAVAALAGLASVVLLSLSFTPFDLWPLAYFALVPWLAALYARRGTARAVVYSWLAGVVFWAINCYWLWWITLAGYAATVLYLSLYWLAAGAVLRAAMRKRWPMWLTLPVVWVALEYARAYVISGFPWFFMAHSQWSVTTLIQVSDLTGQYGLSFALAMANGAIADAVLVFLGGKLQPEWKPTHKGRIVLGWAVTSARLRGDCSLWPLASEPGDDESRPGRGHRAARLSDIADGRSAE